MASNATFESNDNVQPEARRTYVAPTLILLADHQTEVKTAAGTDAGQNS